MQEFIMIVGLPSSGKSELAKEYQKNGVKVLSSDLIREELFNDRQYQKKNKEVFDVMNARAIEMLNNGESVLFDATNIHSDKRIELLKLIPDGVHKKCVYIIKSKELCIYDDARRKYSVGKEVINEYYKKLQIPMYHEGWDEIDIVPAYNIIDNRFYYNVFENKLSYDGFLSLYEELGLDVEYYDIPHDTRYNSFSTLRQAYYTYSYVFENYHEEDRFEMLMASLLYVIGKADCKTFPEGSKYATYKHASNVSAQITLATLINNGYDKEFSLRVATLVQMYIMSSIKNGLVQKKLVESVGKELADKLLFLNKAERFTKI